MGKKFKPSQAGRAGEQYAKTNKSSFSLIFLCNIIDEEKVEETLSYNPKTERSMIHRSAKKNVRGFCPATDDDDEPPQIAEPEKVPDSSSSEEDDDDEDFEENEKFGSSKEVYVDQIRKDLSSREEAHDIGGDIINILNDLVEPRDFDHLLNIVCQIFGLTFEKQKMIEPTDYLTRFNVNFELSSEFTFLKFDGLLTVLYKLLSFEKFKKYCVEIPFDVIHRQKINLEMNSRQLDSSSSTKFWVQKFYLGSQLNLSKFYCHFKLPINQSMAKVPMIMELNFLKKYLIVNFMLDSKARMHKIYYSFSSFRTIIMERRPNFTRVYIECIQAPLMSFVDLNEGQQKLNLRNIDICDIPGIEKRWMRTVKFGFLPQTSAPQRNKYGGYSEKPKEPAQDENLLGMARTFCFEVPNDNPILPVLIKMAYLSRERIKSFQFFLSSVELIESWPKLLYSEFKTEAMKYEFRFSIYFALLVLFSDSYKVLDSFAAEDSVDLLLDVIEDFIYNIPRDKEKESIARLEQCIYLLKTMCRECVIIHPYSEFQRILKNIDSIIIDDEREDYVTIRRATLFPSHLELVQPVSLLRSRFADLADVEYGLRMTFADDNGGFLNKCKDEREKQFMLDIMKPYLRDGIRLGDRLYEMLGSSTSQMRDCGCTLYARDKRGRRAEDVRKSAGKLSSFQSPSKLIARFGLVFSQSMTIIPLDSDVIIKYTPDVLGHVKPDTKDYHNSSQEKYILSDGIGIVASDVAKSWLPYLQVKNNYVPSAYQIRLGGCKGMLTSYPVSASSEKTVFIRNSMKKYESDSRSIGILKYSSPRPVYLNRPLINILDHLKVDKDELYAYFYKSTSSVVKATLYDSCAMDLIHTYSSGLLPYEKVLNSGISLLDEPFLRSIINYLIYYRLNFELKMKARIRVPNDRGRIAFGVLDEYSVLQPGEVYFQYTKLRDDNSMVVEETVVAEGEVMVTKFPCLQPGDVRKFMAVAHPKLKHIKDCLVFPRTGGRSHCDEMGGSDLDGDEYAIFIDPEKKIYFPEENREPMDFPYGLNSNKAGGITVDDMAEFFLKYLMLNNIGVVANTHLMYSDFLPDGLDDPDCESLAYLYNVSLDFPKTGVIMEMPRRDCTLAIRPDFMERSNNDEVYLSKKMLGEYFRHCSFLERAIELSRYDYRFTTFTPIKDKKKQGRDNHQSTMTETFQAKNSNSFIKNKLILQGWKKFYKQANDALGEYRAKITDLMEQLEVENEVMLFADVYENKKDVCKVLLDRLFANFQKKFLKQCESLKITHSIDRLYLASAWYAICHDRKFTHNGRPILGLPWLVANEICQLAMFSFSGKVATEAALAQQFRRTINSEGEIFEIQMGINHKQVVPYSLPQALICDMLFEYKTINVYGTDVIHHYWCPFKMFTYLRSNYPKLIPIVYLYIEEMQFKLVMKMVMKFFDMLKRRVYNETGDLQWILHFPDQIDEKTGREKVTSEAWFIHNTIKKRLEEIVKSCGRKTNDGIESLPTVSTLFNRVLYYLFDICNRVNSAIHHATLEELFLMKFAVFALSFIDKLDTKSDRRFYLDFSIKFERRRAGNILLFQLMHQRQERGEPLGSRDIFPPNGMYSAYETSLDVLFNSYLLDNNYLTEETISVFLPPMDNRIDILAEQDVLIPKLRYLSGVTDVQFIVTSNNTWGQMAEEGNLQDELAGPDGQADVLDQLRQQEILRHPNRPLPNNVLPDNIDSKKSLIGKLGRKTDVLKTVPYEVKVTGFVHTTVLFRTLIGHPSFFPKIYPVFNLSTYIRPPKKDDQK